MRISDWSSDVCSSDLSRTMTVDDFILALVPDIAPDPEQVAFARLEMERAFQALHAMPERRRQLFLARWRDGMPQAEIALEFGLHKRSVQKELARAETFLRKVLRRPKLKVRRSEERRLGTEGGSKCRTWW